MDPDRYKGHSFRIGAAFYAAEQGVSNDKIRHLSRWKSDAYKKHIRITSLESVSYWNVLGVVMLLLAGAAQHWHRILIRSADYAGCNFVISNIMSYLYPE